MDIIPQTVEQAVQRDALHDRAQTPVGTTLHTELQDLRNAIHEHQARIEDAGPLGNSRSLSAAQRKIMRAKQQADEELWAHLPSPTGTAEPK